MCRRGSLCSVHSSGEVDPVYGNPISREWPRCNDERTDGECGPDGKLFVLDPAKAPTSFLTKVTIVATVLGALFVFIYVALL